MSRTEKDLLKLIKLVKSRPILYARKARDKNSFYDTWIEVAKLMRWTVIKSRTKWSFLRNTFVSKMRKGNKPHCLQKELEFLKPYITSYLTSSPSNASNCKKDIVTLSCTTPTPAQKKPTTESADIPKNVSPSPTEIKYEIVTEEYKVQTPNAKKTRRNSNRLQNLLSNKTVSCSSNGITKKLNHSKRSLHVSSTNKTGRKSAVNSIHSPSKKSVELSPKVKNESIIEDTDKPHIRKKRSLHESSSIDNVRPESINKLNNKRRDTLSVISPAQPLDEPSGNDQNNSKIQPNPVQDNLPPMINPTPYSADESSNIAIGNVQHETTIETGQVKDDSFVYTRPTATLDDSFNNTNGNLQNESSIKITHVQGFSNTINTPSNIQFQSSVKKNQSEVIDSLANNANELFLKSILPDLNKLSLKKQRVFKRNALELLENLFEEDEINSTALSQRSSNSYTTSTPMVNLPPGRYNRENSYYALNK